MKCSICGKPVVLVPSAEERAKKYGNSPSFYRSLFKTHAACALKKRADETKALIAKINAVR